LELIPKVIGKKILGPVSPIEGGPAPIPNYYWESLLIFMAVMEGLNHKKVEGKNLVSVALKHIFSRQLKLKMLTAVKPRVFSLLSIYIFYIYRGL